ncbi:MAG: CHAT domain-containing protein [Leptolyngbyaceae cyanobacterium RM1_405_57]|nr:CHAT domain-containing protein [Leptolyngbyaceae cyanobacterium RM1_405_57]
MLNASGGERAENIEQAIDAYEQALIVRTRQALPVDWANTMVNLANAYSKRVCGERADNIEKAIANYEKALTVVTHQKMPIARAHILNNLAVAYKYRLRGENIENLGKAITAYQDSLAFFKAEFLPNECLRTATNLGLLYSEQCNWAAAAVAYTDAFAAAESLYQSCLLLDSKTAELEETDGLPRRAAYALARTGKYQAAIEALEKGRARGLSESLSRDRANLDQLQQQNPDLYDRYKDFTRQIRNLEAIQRDRMISDDRHSITPEALRNTALNLHHQLTTTVEQIRQQPGYEIFLTLPMFEDVQKAATSECPLVYLLTTSTGSLALIVTPTNIHHLWLDDFTDTQLTSLLETWFTTYKNAWKERQTWLNTIDQTTRQLWSFLIGSLVQKLKDLGYTRTTLIPTGSLSFLPLHAAWTEDSNIPTNRHYAFDDIHFTYAPNAKSLTTAQTIADLTSAHSILAIDNPIQDPKLVNSEREVQVAISHFDQHTVLRHSNATRENVRAHLPKAAIVHFACHGKAYQTETEVKDPRTQEVRVFSPLDSCIQMSDGNLTLKDIFALNLSERDGIRLAILSACETGLVGTELADEAISLPTGLLQAGVAAIIASLWAVSDLSTMLLLSKFYELWRTENQEPPEALRQAQIWLRDSTEAEIAPLLGRRTRNPTNHPFSHPYYWAAFSYTGV